MAKPNRLLLRLPAKAKAGATWEIDLADLDAPPKKVAKYPDGVTLGDSNDSKKPYHLDLSELAGTMERWVKKRRSAAGSEGDASGDVDGATARGVRAGPHDIVYPYVTRKGGRDALELRLIQNKATYAPDGTIESIKPERTVAIDYAPTRQAMRTLFRSGTILMFLQQTTFPIGVTCYLLNLLALDGVDPDGLD